MICKLFRHIGGSHCLLSHALVVTSFGATSDYGTFKVSASQLFQSSGHGGDRASPCGVRMRFTVTFERWSVVVSIMSVLCGGG